MSRAANSDKELPSANMRFIQIGCGLARLNDLYSVMLSTLFGPIFMSPADVEELMEDLEQQLQIIELLITSEARASRAMSRRSSLAGMPEREQIYGLRDSAEGDDVPGVPEEKTPPPNPELDGGESDGWGKGRPTGGR